MIEINLLPGAGRKSRGRRSGVNLKAVLADSISRVKDPYLIAAITCVIASSAAVGWMHLTQRAQAAELAQRTEKAQLDSARFVTVIRERRPAEASRDSVRRTLEIIRAIDNDRYVWAHVLDEVSRALPPYTWLKSVAQLAVTLPPGS